jgi:hypothetical protein
MFVHQNNCRKRPLLLNISEFTYQTGFDSLERLVDAQNGESDES